MEDARYRRRAFGARFSMVAGILPLLIFMTACREGIEEATRSEEAADPVFTHEDEATGEEAAREGQEDPSGQMSEPDQAVGETDLPGADYTAEDAKQGGASAEQPAGPPRREPLHEGMSPEEILEQRRQELRERGLEEVEVEITYPPPAEHHTPSPEASRAE